MPTADCCVERGTGVAGAKTIRTLRSLATRPLVLLGLLWGMLGASNAPGETYLEVQTAIQDTLRTIHRRQATETADAYAARRAAVLGRIYELRDQTFRGEFPLSFDVYDSYAEKIVVEVLVKEIGSRGMRTSRTFAAVEIDPADERWLRANQNQARYVTDVAIDADNKLVFIGAATLNVGSRSFTGETQPRMVPATTHTTSTPDEVTALAISSTGARLAIAHKRRRGSPQLTLFDVERWDEGHNGREMFSLQTDQPFERLAFSQDGSSLLTFTARAPLVVSVESGEAREVAGERIGNYSRESGLSEAQLGQIRNRFVRVEDAAISPNGTYVAVATDAGLGRWNLRAREFRYINDADTGRRVGF